MNKQAARSQRIPIRSSIPELIPNILLLKTIKIKLKNLHLKIDKISETKKLTENIHH